MRSKKVPKKAEGARKSQAAESSNAGIGVNAGLGAEVSADELPRSVQTFLRIHRAVSKVAHITTMLFAIVAIVALLAGVGATASGCYRLVPVLGNSMQPAFNKGDVAIVERVSSRSLHVGSVLVANPPREFGDAVIHRVVRVDQSGKFVKTKGDANATADVWNTTIASNDAWVMRWIVPQLATIMWKLQHGLLPIVIATVIIPAFLLLCLQRIWQFNLSAAIRKRVHQRFMRKRNIQKINEATKPRVRRRLVALFALLVLLMQGNANGLFTSNASASGGAISSASIVESTPTSPNCWFSGNNNIVMSWTPNASSVVDGYDMQRSDAPDGPFESIGTVPGGASVSGGFFAFSNPVSSHFVVKAKRNSWRSNAAAPTLPSVSCSRTLSTYLRPPTTITNTVIGGQFRGIASIGNTLYFADSIHDVIWAMDRTTNVITVAAGSFTDAFADGNANVAAFSDPYALVADAARNAVYIADHNNNRIRKLDLLTSTVSTVAGTGDASAVGDGGAATSAGLATPSDIALDGLGNLYIADTANQRIRKIVLATGIISTVAGNGSAGSAGDGGLATAAQLNNPSGVYVATNGVVYIADTSNNKVRMMNTSGVISTVVGTGVASSTGDGGQASVATIHAPTDIDFDASGNGYLVESNGHRVRKVVPSTGIISTFTGSGAGYVDGALASAKFDVPFSLHIAANGDSYIADWNNYRIRVIPAGTGNVSTAVGNGGAGECCTSGVAGSTLAGSPRHVAFDNSGDMYVTEASVIRKIAFDGTTSIYAGDGISGFAGDGGAATGARLNFPSQLVFDVENNLYFADTSNHRIRKIDRTTKVITTIAGTGIGGVAGDGGSAISAQLQSPRGVAVDNVGNIYIADSTNNRIRKVSASGGNISTIYGDGTPTKINQPYAIKLTNNNAELLISDTGNHRVRKLHLGALTVSTIAGTGASSSAGDGGLAVDATISGPRGLDVDSAGNIYFASASNSVRVISAATGRIYTVAGGNGVGTSGDGALGTSPTAKFNIAYDVAVNSTSGDFVVVDSASHRIRKLTR